MTRCGADAVRAMRRRAHAAVVDVTQKPHEYHLRIAEDGSPTTVDFDFPGKAHRAPQWPAVAAGAHVRDRVCLRRAGWNL